MKKLPTLHFASSPEEALDRQRQFSLTYSVMGWKKKFVYQVYK